MPISQKKVNKLHPLSLAIALITSSSLAPIALAQENTAEAEDEKKYEAITVTATKRPQVIYEVPIALSAFDGDKLAEQGITDLTDVGKFVPNLNVTGFSGGHTSSVNPFIRGIGLQDHLITTDPGVSVYVDGVYLGRQVGQNWNLNNIERIEVLRGPQGTLYGRNSIGGAINIITKQPDEVDVTKLNAEVGSRGRVKTDLFVNHGLSDKLYFNLNLGFNRRDGLGEFLNVPNAEYDVGEMEEVYGRFSLKYEASDEFRVIFTADANNGDGGLRPYTTLIDEVGSSRYAGGGNSLGVNLSNADVAADPYDNATGAEEVTSTSNEARGLSLTTEWDINDEMMLKVVASNRTSKYKAGLDDDGTIYELDQFPERGEADQSSLEIQLSGFIGENADFVTGLYWFNEEGSNRQPASEARFDGGPTILELDQDATSKAAFVNIGYDMTDSFRLSGGLRYTQDEKDAVANVLGALGPIYASDDWNELTWEIAGNYTLDNGLNFYATVQTGYQSGQYPARPYFLIGEFIGAGGFSGEPGAIEAAQQAVRASNGFVASENITAVNYEMGLKGRLTDWFDMSIAVFNTEYEDLPYQVSRIDENAGFITELLVVEQTSRGIEWDSTINVDNFSMQVSVGVMDVEVDEINGVTPVAPLTPDLTLAIGPSYKFDLGSAGSIRARMDYSYRDDMYGEPTDLPGRFTQIDSRELVNFDIAYTPEDEAYTVALYGRNIFDERYDNARLNTGDYVLAIMSNDASEFGVRFTTEF